MDNVDQQVRGESGTRQILAKKRDAFRLARWLVFVGFMAAGMVAFALAYGAFVGLGTEKLVNGESRCVFSPLATTGLTF